MPADVILGLDAGTSVIKAVAFDPDGRQIGRAVRANALAPVAGGGVEQDLGETWRAAAETLRELAATLPGLPSRVAAVAVTGQGDGTWLIDAAGEPVGRSMLWLDARSGGIVADWRSSGVGPATYAVTGTGLNQSSQSGQLRWLADHQPERLARAATVCHCKDWLYFRLTGARATDPAEAIWTFGDFRTGEYDAGVLERFGLAAHRHLLPEIVDARVRHHRLGRDAAGVTGLREGTPVVLAPVDMLTTGLGAGVYEPDGRVGCSILGSTGAHLRVRHRLGDVHLADQVGYTMPFPADGTWLQLVSNMAATLNIDWFVKGLRELLRAIGVPVGDDADVLARLDPVLAEVPPGRLVYHPFIAASGERGPFVNPWARAQFLGLSVEATQLDMARAVYEGIAFAARDCYGVLDTELDEIRLTGGAAQSATLRGILAAALGVPVRPVGREEAGAAGAAIVATLALGHFEQLADACRTWVAPYLGDAVVPDPALQARYEALYPVYRSGYAHSEEFWRGFAATNPGDLP